MQKNMQSELHNFEQNYGSTLVFCVVATQFDTSGESVSYPQVKTRVFEATSENLSSKGHWRCLLTETMQQATRSVDLRLSLKWIHDSEHGLSALCEPDSFISQIRSVKVHSDTTLSELVVTRVDGERILHGASIEMNMEAGRVTRCGRYKFRVALHTQDISRSQFLDRPIFTSFLDLDTSFNPTEYLKSSPPDVCFYFPVSSHCFQPTHIYAHSSELKGSNYLLSKFAELKRLRRERDAKAKGKEQNFECTVTEFSPGVFRVMLQFMYTGKMGLKKLTIPKEEAPLQESHQVYDMQQEQKPIGFRRAERCHFEDLYKIAERYEVHSLKEPALKAIRNTLNMLFGISLLTSTSLDKSQADISCQIPSERVLDESTRTMMMDIVKEYILFFGTEIFSLGDDSREQKKDFSVADGRGMISYLGEHVLGNLVRLWQ
ncbi:hypothetical protein BG004_003438 [Podila humilis]|nr:hypothetical protein BG004_003438 [Podila humilis]